MTQPAIVYPSLPLLRLAVPMPQVPPFLACQRCDHVVYVVGDMHCTLRAGARHPVPVALARSRTGACGPDAKHQADPTDHVVAAP